MSEYSHVLLPASLEPLRTLARNLRWSWHRPTGALFERIDPTLWKDTRHNPVRLLARAPAARLEALAADESFLAEMRRAESDLQRYLRTDDTWWASTARDDHSRIAYFSAEFGITECLPIFAGGLGVLAGDHLKSASDLGVPLVGVGLLYREGYFRQEIDAQGRQRAGYRAIDPETLPLTPELGPTGEALLVSMPFLDRRLHARIWRADVGRVPLYLLDTDVPENAPEDRRVTDRLYGGDTEHRLRQEIVLGIGGMRALRALGIEPAAVHLNEGHAAFAAVERAHGATTEPHAAFRLATGDLAAGVVFTTHTPVPAGHDRFPPDLLERYLGGYVWEMGESWDRFLALGRREGEAQESLCMTTLAIRLSGRRNGVSRLHGQVSREMWHDLWPDVDVDHVPIGHVTNGVHLPTWVSEPTASLYADYLGHDWTEDGDELRWRRAPGIPRARIWAARGAQRAALVVEARRRLAAQAARRGEDPAWTAGALDTEALTIVFARRFATYKRATLLLSQPERLERLLTGERALQFVFAGKAHPRDLPGQEMLRQVALFAARPEIRGRFVLLDDYDVELARHLVAGADVWLNVPVRPHEASGTSGMKAAANGALNLSIPDGWWAEAWTDHNRSLEPIGWSIDAGELPDEEQDAADAEALFTLLERDVLPLFHDRDEDGLPARWIARIRASMGQVVPYFSTHRMVRDYAESYYLPAVADGLEVREDRTAIA